MSDDPVKPPETPPLRTATVSELPVRPTRISEEALMLSRLRSPTDRPPQNPFKLPNFPPGVGPPKEQPQLAMDASYNSLMGWAGGESVYAAETMYSAYAEGVVFLGFSYLASLAQRAEYRVITETIASEMTREWIELKSVSDDDSKSGKLKELEDALDRYKLQDVFRKAAESDGFFGRGHIYIDTGDTDDRDELVTAIGNGRDEISHHKIQHHSVKAFRPVEAIWAYPTHYESVDPLKPGWYDPYQWYVMSKPVHRSRLLTLIGREVPDILKPAYAFGGLSMSQMVKPYVDNWLETRQSVADLIRSFSVFVLRTNMDATTGAGGEDLFRRVQIFNNFKDNQGTMVIDKNNEDFANVSVPMGGLDALQAQSQEQMASISRIPIVKLLGIQPAGLNASSEGELISFYDWIHSFQETLFRQPLTTCIDFIQLSEFGEIDDDITFEFKSLRQLDEGQKASIQSQTAQTHATYVEMGSISADEVREALTSDPESPYAGLDLSEPLPTPMGMPGMPQLPGLGGGPGEMAGGGSPGQEPPGPGSSGPQPGPGGSPQTDMVNSPETKGWKSPLWNRDKSSIDALLPEAVDADPEENAGENIGLDIRVGFDAALAKDAAGDAVTGSDEAAQHESAENDARDEAEASKSTGKEERADDQAEEDDDDDDKPHELIPKAEVEYEHPAQGDEHCGACQFFRSPDGCELVEPPIQPEDWCNLFDAKEQAAADQGLSPLDPDLAALAEGKQYNIVQAMYAIQAQRDRQRQPDYNGPRFFGNDKAKDEVPPSESPELNEAKEDLPTPNITDEQS